MAERDESMDIATYLDCGVRDWCDWGELERGARDVVRYVPHSDLEAAEKERDALRQEVARLVEALGIARRRIEKLAATRVTLCRLRTAIDQAIVNLPKGEA